MKKTWPQIPYERFKESGNALHMWLQIVGKCRLAKTPWVNHSWHATFYLTARGLTTSLIPSDTKDYEVTFDFNHHKLFLQTTDGEQESLPLGDMSVQEFQKQLFEKMQRLGLSTNIHTTPNEVPDPIPFHKQTQKLAYDQEAVTDFWQALVHIDRVFKHFRTSFLGKVSPVHLFWGSFDLAVTRFSGNKAPLHPGGIPALPDDVTREAYSHQVSSAGFWPGGPGLEEPIFYSYAYPTPEGFAEAVKDVPHAYYHKDLGEYVLPYEKVRTSQNPKDHLMQFLQATYEAAASLGNWDRKNLERPLCEPKRVPDLAPDHGEIVNQ